MTDKKLRGTIHIHRVPREVYDALPVEETEYEGSYWKSLGDDICLFPIKEHQDEGIHITLFIHGAATPTDVTGKSIGNWHWNAWVT